jgi:GNAT superfamily N-acetyltransferase
VPRFSDPEPLGARHILEGFDCGEDSLNVWLCRHARGATGSGSARAFVTVDAEQERVVGYHALTAASIEHPEATGRVQRGMPQHPIPVMLLARLAVDRSVQGHGLGAWLLTDAMERALAAAEILGIRALVVHALNDNAREFYLRHGLGPSPTDERHLMILLKDIRAVLAKRHRSAQ